MKIYARFFLASLLVAGSTSYIKAINPEVREKVHNFIAHKKDTSLDLSNAELTDDDLAKVLEIIKGDWGNAAGRLWIFNLSNNQISSAAPLLAEKNSGDLYDIVNLRELNLSNNKLKTPRGNFFEKLPKLKILDTSNNTELPSNKQSKTLNPIKNAEKTDKCSQETPKNGN